mgnify:CR=1 FL=1
MQVTEILTDHTLMALELRGTPEYPIRFYLDIMDQFDRAGIHWHWHPELEFNVITRGTMEGDIKDRFVSVELGGLVGMVFTVIALLAITFLTPVLGSFFGFLIPLAVVLFVLIILHPYAPKVLNNVGFAYLTVACIDSAAFAANLPLFFGVYIAGSLVFNGGCVLLMKPARYLAARSIKNDVKADA